MKKLALSIAMLLSSVSAQAEEFFWDSAEEECIAVSDSAAYMADLELEDQYGNLVSGISVNWTTTGCVFEKDVKVNMVQFAGRMSERFPKYTAGEFIEFFQQWDRRGDMGFWQDYTPLVFQYPGGKMITNFYPDKLIQPFTVVAER